MHAPPQAFITTLPLGGNSMNIRIGAVALVALLFFSLDAVTHADTVNATIGCATAANTTQGMDTSCTAPGGGTATLNTTGGYSSTGIQVTLTSITGLTFSNPANGAPIIEDLDPTAPEQWTFAFANGDFTITDADSDFLVNGTYTVTGTGTNSVTLTLVPTQVTFSTDDLSQSLVINTPTASGTATISYMADPTVTGVSISTQFPPFNPPTPAPDPSTLVLLSAGLAGVGLLTRRRVVA